MLITSANPGRPDRLYCSPTHRSAARQARRDAGRVGQVVMAPAGAFGAARGAGPDSELWSVLAAAGLVPPAEVEARAAEVRASEAPDLTGVLASPDDPDAVPCPAAPVGIVAQRVASLDEAAGPMAPVAEAPCAERAEPSVVGLTAAALVALALARTDENPADENPADENPARESAAADEPDGGAPVAAVPVASVPGADAGAADAGAVGAGVPRRRRSIVLPRSSTSGGPAVADRPAARVSRRPSVPVLPAPRRRRALAVLGAAGVLVAGYCLTASVPDAAATSPSVLAVPQLSDEREWAGRAEVVLASVDSQLDVISRAEAEWYAVPADARAARADAIDKLLRRKAYLETQRTLLQTQLATYHSLTSANDDLRLTEQQLAYIRRELDIATDPAKRTAAQAALVAALEENRRSLERRRDSKQAEVRGLSGDVNGAATVPLVDDPSLTERAAADVRRVVEDPTAPPPHRTGPDHRPDAVNGRLQQRDGSPVPEIGTGAPPDPGQRSDDTSRLAAGDAVERVIAPIAHVESEPDEPPAPPQGAPRLRSASVDTPAEQPSVDPPPAETPPAQAPPAEVRPASTPPASSQPAPAQRSASVAPTTASAPSSGSAGFVDTMSPSWSWMAPGMAAPANAAAKQAMQEGSTQQTQQPAQQSTTDSGGSDDPERAVG